MSDEEYNSSKEMYEQAKPLVQEHNVQTLFPMMKRLNCTVLVFLLRSRYRDERQDGTSYSLLAMRWWGLFVRWRIWVLQASLLCAHYESSRVYCTCYMLSQY